MLFTRIRAALAAAPAARHVRFFLIEFAWLLPVLLAIGFAGGLMRWAPALDGRTLQLALIAILAPALGEELLFRAALLPRPHSGPLPWPPVL